MVGPNDLHDRETLADMAEEELDMLDNQLLSELATTAAEGAQTALLGLKTSPYSARAKQILHVSLGQLDILDKLGVGPDWAGCPDVSQAFCAVFYRYPATDREEQPNG